MKILSSSFRSSIKAKLCLALGYEVIGYIDNVAVGKHYTFTSKEALGWMGCYKKADIFVANKLIAHRENTYGFFNVNH